MIATAKAAREPGKVAVAVLQLLALDHLEEVTRVEEQVTVKVAVVEADSVVAVVAEATIEVVEVVAVDGAASTNLLKEPRTADLPPNPSQMTRSPRQLQETTEPVDTVI